MGPRALLTWADNDANTNYWLTAASIAATLIAGLASGLTLGLMSLDNTELEVLMRSGTPREHKNARRIMPLIKNTHHLLVTLLLVNAAASTTLPLFLDELVDPLGALLLSVSAVLLFGEIIPQALCARYGLEIGARFAPIVRLLMVVTSPLSWTIGRLLDLLLGHQDNSLFRRQQLKALVDVHGEATGLGGKLTLDEIKIITGALDLTTKIAYRAMTPLPALVSLSSDDRLDEETLGHILDSGHSRVPVHRADNPADLVGLLLVKELLQYKGSKGVPVSVLKLRSLPRLPADIPMYDLLKLFQTGRSHMVVLTQPDDGGEEGASGGGEQPGGEISALPQAQDGPSSTGGTPQPVEAQQAQDEVVAGAAVPIEQRRQEHSSVLPPHPHVGSHGSGHGGGSVGAHEPSRLSRTSVLEDADRLGAQPVPAPPTTAHAHPHAPHLPTVFGTPISLAGSAVHGGAGEVLAAGVHEGGGTGWRRLHGEVSVASSPDAVGSLLPGSLHPPVFPVEFRVEYEDTDGGSYVLSEDAAAADEEAMAHAEDSGAGDAADAAPGALAGTVTRTARHRRHAWQRVPKLAPPGQPIGVICLEDVIEELIRTEIVDETDRFVDNTHQVRVEQAVLAAHLPERLRQVAMADARLPGLIMQHAHRGGVLGGQRSPLTAPLLANQGGGEAHGP